MKKSRTKNQNFDIFMGILVSIYGLIPWMSDGKMNYNILLYLFRCLWTGDSVSTYRQIFFADAAVSGQLGNAALWFAAACAVLVWIQGTGVIACVIAVKGGYMTRLPHTAALITMLPLMLALQSIVMEGGYLDAVRNGSSISTGIYIYVLAGALLEGIWLFGSKLAEGWDTASRCAKEEKRQKEEYKKERKKRLYFPGRYAGLYYHILWKNIKYRRRDIAIVLFAVFLSALLLFTGISMRRIFAVEYGEDYSRFGLGITHIVKDFLIVIVLLDLVFTTLVLVFYRKKRAESMGAFQTLGMRRSAYLGFWIAELLICFTVSTAAYRRGRDVCLNRVLSAGEV